MQGAWVVTGHFGHKEQQEEACRRHCWRKQCVGRREGDCSCITHTTHVHTCSDTTHTHNSTHTTHVHTPHACAYHTHAYIPPCSYTTHMLTHSIYVHIDHTCSQVFTHMLTHTHTLVHSTHAHTHMLIHSTQAHALSGTNSASQGAPPWTQEGSRQPLPCGLSSLQPAAGAGELSFKNRPGCQASSERALPQTPTSTCRGASAR